MLPIRKGESPKELVKAVHDIRNTPDAVMSWRNVNANARAAVLRSLLKEQGGLCAYCMRGINEAGAHVEHIVPQSRGAGGDDPASVDYQNMLAVCDGFAGEHIGLTCDKSRGDTALVVNPLRPETLKGIRYQRDGVITSDDPDVKRDLTQTLNLNHPRHRDARLSVYKGRRKMLENKARKDGDAAVASFCARYVEEHLSDPGSRKPYDGVLIYFMQKRARHS